MEVFSIDIPPCGISGSTGASLVSGFENKVVRKFFKSAIDDLR
jgi:hypothetical protein